MDISQLQNDIQDILKAFHHKPFLCLPMSAELYARMRDNHGLDAFLITGNLTFNDEIIFKQDFSIEDPEAQSKRDWAGHAWVEFEDYIIDLSIFRTLYSDDFTKSCKARLIKYFGLGKGAIISQKNVLKQQGLYYQAIDKLKDETATSIIQGMSKLPIWD